jgi:hypothetical protein
MKKIICNQCKKCQLPYLPNDKIPCSDTNCKCHKEKQEDPIKKHFSGLGKRSWEKRKAKLLTQSKNNDK